MGTPSATVAGADAGAGDGAEADQPAWKRGMIVRPSRRSTSAPSTFIATSHDADADAVGRSSADRGAGTEPSTGAERPRRTSPAGRRDGAAAGRTAPAPQRSISAPVVGSASTEPTAIASSSRPEGAVGQVERRARVSGIRETSVAKQKPLRANASATALRAAVSASAEVGASGRGHQVGRAPGGAASSQDWKPISEDGLIASSTSPCGVRSRSTTWSAYSDICSRALRVTPTDVGQVGARHDPLRPRREREDAEPLQVSPGVAAEPEQPTAPGRGGPGAVAELEGAAVAREVRGAARSGRRRRAGPGRAGRRRRRAATATSASASSSPVAASHAIVAHPSRREAAPAQVRRLLDRPDAGLGPAYGLRARVVVLAAAWPARGRGAPSPGRSRATSRRARRAPRRGCWPPRGSRASTAATQVSPSAVWMSTTPSTSTDSIGAWSGQDADVTLRGARDDHRRLARTTRGGPRRRARPAASSRQPSEALLDLGPLGLDVVETTAHEERLLGDVVVLAVGDLVERLDGVRRPGPSSPRCR